MNFPHSNYPSQNFSEIQQIKDNEKSILKNISMGHFWIFLIMIGLQIISQVFFIISLGFSNLSFMLLIATLVGDLVCYQFFIKKINYPVKDMIRPRFHNLDKYLKPDILLMFFVASSGLNILGSYIGSALSGMSTVFFHSYSTRAFGAFSSGNYDIFVVISALIVAPIMEEIIFRGAILKPLRRYGDGFAIFISSILFSLAHGNLRQIPPTFLLGLVFGYITVKSNSILPGIILHFFNNLIVVMEDFAIYSLGFSSMSFRFIDLITFMAAVVLIVLFLRKREGRPRLFDDIDAIPAYYHPQKKELIYFKPFIIAALVAIVAGVLLTAISFLMFIPDIIDFIIEFWQMF